MNFLKNIGKAVENAANYVGEKNRRAAALNRIRGVIRCEEKAAEKEYLALGRYYYNNLRDKDNPVTEPHCVELESILYGQQENRRVTCFRRAAWGIFITLTLLILARSALLCGNNLFFPIATGEVLDTAQRQTRFRITEIWTALEGLALTVALVGFLVLLCLELAWRIPVSLRQRAIYLGVLAGSLLGISYCFAWADPIFHAPINYTLVPFRILSRLLFFQLLALIFSAFQRRRRKSVDPQ